MAYEYYILHVRRLDVGNQFGRDVLDRRLIGISPPLRATSGDIELQNPGRTVPGLPGQCFDCLLPDPATMAATMEKCEVTSAHSLLLDVRGGGDDSAPASMPEAASPENRRDHSWEVIFPHIRMNVLHSEKIVLHYATCRRHRRSDERHWRFVRCVISWWSMRPGSTHPPIRRCHSDRLAALRGDVGWRSASWVEGDAGDLLEGTGWRVWISVGRPGGTRPAGQRLPSQMTARPQPNDVAPGSSCPS
jgi:hypothetical protein